MTLEDTIHAAIYPSEFTGKTWEAYSLAQTLVLFITHEGLATLKKAELEELIVDYFGAAAVSKLQRWSKVPEKLPAAMCYIRLPRDKRSVEPEALDLPSPKRADISIDISPRYKSIYLQVSEGLTLLANWNCSVLVGCAEVEPPDDPEKTAEERCDEKRQIYVCLPQASPLVMLFEIDLAQVPRL